MSAEHPELLDGWLPVRLSWHESVPTVEWCYVGAKRLDDPFFGETIGRCMDEPFNQLFRQTTSIDALADRQIVRPGIAPTGFIFHMSRCGSTLVSQMLATHPRTVVVSEAAIVDSVLRADRACPGLTDAIKVDWLRWTVAALAQRRMGGEKYFFLKFDAWSIHDFGVIRAAFPDVPWIFLYRNPVDVLASQLAHRGVHMVPGMIDVGVPGLDASAALTLSPEEYCASVLATVCEAAERHAGRGTSRLVNYSELPAVVADDLLDFFGVECTAADLDRMSERAVVDAKNPYVQFEGGGGPRRRPPTEAMREATEKLLAPVYERLERIRAVQQAAVGRSVHV